MLDDSVVELCAQCLVGAMLHEGGESDLALTVTALARDLADAQPAQATAVLDAAARDAASYLDASDLGPLAFAAALRRLTNLCTRVLARLTEPPAYAGPLAA